MDRGFSDKALTCLAYYQAGLVLLESAAKFQEYLESVKATISALVGFLLWAVPLVARAQLTFTTNGGSITITGYTGPRGEVAIPGSTNGYPVTSIGASALSSAIITGVALPNSITNIGADAFYISEITNIFIPSGVIEIGSNAFGQCVDLTNIDVDPQNTNYSSVAGVLFDKSQGTLIQFPLGDYGTYAIPGSVTNIAEDAFANCGGLFHLTIPDNVITIGAMAFSNNVNLASAIIGNGVTTIGAGAFYLCPELESLTIGQSVTNIPDNAFWACSSLRDIVIPDSVKNIGSNAFYEAINLTNINFGTGVTNIGPGAFAYGSGLVSPIDLPSLTIGSNVVSIGSNAFLACFVGSVVFPASVTSLGYGAFESDVFLTNIDFYGNAPAAGSNVFNNVHAGATIYYVPGTSGWGTNFAGLPTALWALPYPLILNTSVQDSQFGFDISWLTNISAVVEGSTDLASAAWVPLQTNTFTNGLSHFNDPAWVNYSNRFYRVSAH
jgi:hypothetical protein